MSKVLIFHGAETAGVSVEVGDEWAFFPHGEPVEVSDGFAAQLLGEYPGTFSTTDHPQQNATKDAWHAFRAAQGHTDIDGLTKAELIDLPDVPANKES